MKGRNMQIFSKQRGAVSLFIVIFTMLLMTVVTISFIRIMLQDQQQASNLDLSQSAYDSAQAGVEDAKRAILQYQSICAADTSVAQTDCKAAEARVGNQTCNQGLAGIQTVGSDEIRVQQTQSAGDAALDQAYTCVTIQLQTPNYLGSLEANASKVIPLVVPDGRTFNTVTLKWFTQQDLGSTNTFAVDLLPSGSTVFPLAGNWPTNRPSLMRAQLIQLGNSFTLANLDASSTTESDANTLFLYPTATRANNAKLFNTDPHTLPKSTGVGPQAVTCLSSLTAGGYACSATITLPRPFGATANSNGTIPRTAYLRVSGFYNKTNYSVSLAQGATAVPFDAVQPQVDSTGRANDLFRRVQSRIDIVDPAYPDAAVDITGGFCKNFTITDNTADYSAPNTCTP